MSTPRALLLGDPGPLPFCGHFRLQAVGGRASLAAAGRIASSASLEDAFGVARRVEALLRTVTEGAWWDTDRNGVLRRAWSLLQDFPPERLGPNGGADLSILLVASDERGVGVAGCGLVAVWGQIGGRWRALVPPGHPLLCAPGVPRSLPGVLSLDLSSAAFIAAPYGVEPLLPPAEEVEQRCGERA